MNFILRWSYPAPPSSSLPILKGNYFILPNISKLMTPEFCFSSKKKNGSRTSLPMTSELDLSLPRFLFILVLFSRILASKYSSQFLVSSNILKFTCLLSCHWDVEEGAQDSSSEWPTSTPSWLFFQALSFTRQCAAMWDHLCTTGAFTCGFA